MSPSPPSTNTHGLDDIDLIWGSENEIPNQEWSKMEEDFMNAGYREGITAGKEAALQEGFDDGFARVGAPIGRDMGSLRGAAHATMSFLLTPSSSSQGDQLEAGRLEEYREEVQSIVGALGRIRLAELAPRDLQAEEHTREHLESKSLGSDHISVDTELPASPSRTMEYPQILEEDQPTKSAVELDQLRVRLFNLLQEIKLNIDLA